VRKIFDHPTSGNIEWREVHSLLDAVGDVEEEHNGNFKVTLGPETEVIHRPKGKDIDRDLIADLRRMLSEAGFNPDDPTVTEDERTRDHGDSRWGKPTS
jgi:hypothetical protein